MTKPGPSPFRPHSTVGAPGSAAFRPSDSSVGGGPIGVGASYDDPNPTLSAGVDALYNAVAFWDWIVTGQIVRDRMADLVSQLGRERGLDPKKTTGTPASRFSFPFSGALVELRCKVSKTADEAQFALKEFEPFRVLYVAGPDEPTGLEPLGQGTEMRGRSELERVLEASQTEDWQFTYEPRLCHRYWFLVTMQTLVERPQEIDYWRLLASQTRDLSGPSLLDKTWNFLKSLLPGSR